VAKNILNLSEEEFQRMQTEMFYDKKQDTLLEQVAEAMAAAAAPAPPAAGAAPGGDMGGDLGGDLGAEPGAEEAPAEGAEEEAGPLLATPGAEEEAPPPPMKRDDESVFKTFKTDEYGKVMTTTDSSKGKWYRKNPGPDRRNGLGQSQKAWAGMQNTGKSKRSFLKGAEELGINYRLSEGDNSNYYDDEEQQILKNTAEVSKLIESLEKAADETKPQ
jgi:hypothetical protein